MPGTLVHIGEQKMEVPRLSSFVYCKDSIIEQTIKDIGDFKLNPDPNFITWLNIDGIHDTGLIKKLGDIFDIHPLTLEDILNTGQRPKTEEYDGYLFVALKMILFDAETSELNIEQLSLILGPNYVLSFQEKVGDVFEPIRERIRKASGRVRERGADYLFYTLIDALVDNYFILLESFSENIESIEDKLIADPALSELNEIYQLKRQLLPIRKASWPLREAISALYKSEHAMINPKTSIYFRDVYDHTIQIIDTIETQRDMISSMLDVYLSSVSNRMNEVIKVLTIFSVIFIPLTFIVGVYGMNFKNFPELQWQQGYYMVWILMLAVTAGMLVYFKRKKWF